MLKTIGNQFKQPSGFLGRVISALMKKGNSKAYDKLIQLMEIKENEHLLEIGYGHGLGIERILSKINCNISGIDFSELMFKEASKRNKKHIEAGNVELHFGNFLDFEIQPNQYNIIYCTNVVYFWDELTKPFSKIKNGLKENGQFCFYMAHHEDLERMKFTKDGIFNKYTIEHVVDKLKLSGFENIDYQHDKGYYVKCKK